MPYVPKFQEPSESLIIDNVLAIIKRDMKSALDYFYAADNLPDFVERTVGQFVSLDYPKLAIDPNRNGPEQSGDGSWIADNLKVSLFLAVKGTDAPTVTRTLMKYMRALKSILRTAPASDYISGFPAGSIFTPTIEFSYEYGLMGKNATEYMRPAQMDLTLKFNER